MKLDFTEIKINTQYFLPKHLITILVGYLASVKLGKYLPFIIKRFAAHYNIDLNEAEKDISEFETFNEFFSRALKEGKRPIDSQKTSLVFPADGTISQFGTLTDKIIMQAKNHFYSANTLLGGEDGDIFKNGSFITTYLSPSDYHRVHIPCDATLKKMTHIPGRLFSVSAFNAQNIPELFAQNERVVCIFETKLGKMALVFVGATIVRSISTAWAGTVAPSRTEVKEFNYEDKNISFKKGDEIGKFFMGSTVICLFEKNKITFDKKLNVGDKTRMGEKMASSKK